MTNTNERPTLAAQLIARAYLKKHRIDKSKALYTYRAPSHDHANVLAETLDALGLKYEKKGVFFELSDFVYQLAKCDARLAEELEFLLRDYSPDEDIGNPRELMRVSLQYTLFHPFGSEAMRRTAKRAILRGLAIAADNCDEFQDVVFVLMTAKKRGFPLPESVITDASKILIEELMTDLAVADVTENTLENFDLVELGYRLEEELAQPAEDEKGRCLLLAERGNGHALRALLTIVDNAPVYVVEITNDEGLVTAKSFTEEKKAHAYFEALKTVYFDN